MSKSRARRARRKDEQAAGAAMLGVWVQRLRSVGMRRAASQWLRGRRTRRPESEDAVTERLVADWRHLVRVYGDRAKPGHFFALFSALGELSTDELPPSNIVRYYLRSLHSFPTAAGWRRLRHHVRTTPSDVAAWHQELTALRAARSGRHAAAMAFDEMRETMEILASVLYPDMPHLVIEPNDSWVQVEFASGSTDGRRITLPSSIAVSADPHDNALAFVRVLLHELAHVAEGSFALEPAALEHGSLARRLEAARERGVLTVGDRTRSPLEQVLRSVARPQLLHGLFNMVEDQRIEAALGARFPFYERLESWVTRLEEQHRPPTAVSSAEEILFAGLMALLRGRSRAVPIAPRHRDAYAKLEAAVERSPPRKLVDVAEAIGLAIELYEILLDVSEVDAGLAIVIEALADDNDLLAAKRIHDREDLEEPGGEHVSIPHEAESDLDLGVPYFDYPEWSSELQMLEPNVARVHLFGRGRPKVRSSAPDGSAPIALGPVTSRRVPRLRTGGVELDLARAYDWAVQRRVGHEADERIFHATRVRTTPLARSVDFVLDVSTSMGGSRSRDLVPISAARELLRSLVPELQADGWDVSIHGAWDHGRRSIRLYELLKPGEPFGAEHMDGLEVRGFGGFRHGPLVRHFTAVRGGSGHRIVLLTDTASHYVFRGRESWLSAQMNRKCSGCTIRHRCRVDAKRPQLQTGESDMVVYNPTYVEMADLREALESTSSSVALVLFGAYYRDSTVDHAVGAHAWWRVNTDAGVGLAAEGLRYWFDRRRR